MGEGTPSGCVGMMPSAASIVVQGGCSASRGGSPCSLKAPSGNLPERTSPAGCAAITPPAATHWCRRATRPSGGAWSATAVAGWAPPRPGVLMTVQPADLPASAVGSVSGLGP
eukprot:8976703-Alexandrium_andersonii.AAC.1